MDYRHPHLRIYDLRHHAATLTAQMPGLTLKELMARIGHSSTKAALTYQHATAERDQRAASFVGEAIKAATGRPTVVSFGCPDGAQSDVEQSPRRRR